MRLSIVLAICFLGVASASTLTKRNVFDDLQSKGQDAFKNLGQFGQDFNQKLQEAFKNLFGKKNADEATEKTVEKRAINPLELISSLNDPAKFIQTLFKILADMAAQGGLKNDVASEAFKLLSDMNDPAKLSQQMFKVITQVAFQGRPKRDVAQDLAKFAESGKQRAQDAFKPLMDLLNSFKNGKNVEAPITKRAINPLELIASLNDPAKFIQTLFKILADMAAQGGLKNDVAAEAFKLVNDMNDPAKLSQQMFKVFTQVAFQGRPKRDASSDIKLIEAFLKALITIGANGK